MERRSRARVLVLASDDAQAASLGGRLDAFGWAAPLTRGLKAAGEDLGGLRVEAVVIVLPASQDDIQLAAELKRAAEPRRTPVLALGDVACLAIADLAVDLVLPLQAPARQIATRLSSLLRWAIADEEAHVRSATCSHYTASVLPPPLATPLQVLTVGEPASRFLAFSHALTERGLETTAAFTAYTAFDYMHERTFDAVVLWVGETHAEAASIAGGMRRNARLYGVPTLLFVRPGAVVDLAQSYERGFSDILMADISAEDAATRTKVLAAEARREIVVRRSLDLTGAGLLDPETGLFPPDVFAYHLSQIARTMGQRKRALSVAVLRGGFQPRLADVRANGWLARASPQIDAMVARLVRASDSASRLGPDALAIAFPGADAFQAAAATERVAAVIACTAFPAGEGEAPFTTHFKFGVAQIDAESSPSRALELAARRAASKAAA